MKKNTRDYGKPRQNFAGGGFTWVDPEGSGWTPRPNVEDAAGNPTVGHWDEFKEKYVHGESSKEETKNSLAHPGRTVPRYDPFVDVYPIGSHKERQKLESAVEDNIRRTGEPSFGVGTLSTLYPQATSDYYARKKAKDEQGYNKGGVVKKRGK